MRKRISAYIMIFVLIISMFCISDSLYSVSFAAQNNSQKYYIKKGKIYIKSNNKLVKNRIVSIKNKKYYATKNGNVLKNKIFKFKGNKYFSQKTGVIAQNKIFSYKNKKYFAHKNGVIANNKLVSYKGKKYYAGNTGQLLKNRIIEIDGKQFYVNNKYTIVTNRTITYRNKKYIADKNGFLTLYNSGNISDDKDSILEDSTESTTELKDDHIVTINCEHDWDDYDEDFDETDETEKEFKKGKIARAKICREVTSDSIIYGYAKENARSYNRFLIECEYPTTRYKCSKCGMIRTMFLKNTEYISEPIVSYNYDVIEAFKKVYYSDILGYGYDKSMKGYTYSQRINYINHYNLQNGLEPMWFYSVSKLYIPQYPDERYYYKEGYYDNYNDNYNVNDFVVDSPKIITDKEITESYTYSIEPLLPPFNNYFYVKTDNPNPETFVFVDKESKYTNKEQMISLCKTEFADVEYEDINNFRVKGGYIFQSNYSGYLQGFIDGGELTIRWESNLNYSIAEDTNIIVDCPEVKNLFDYLESKYTTSDMSVLMKIKAVDNAVNTLAIYPQKLTEYSRKNGYAYLYTSIYEDQARQFCIHSAYPKYIESNKSLLAWSIYPFMLNSYSLPEMIKYFAKYIENSVIIEPTSEHPYFKIFYENESITIGGAGVGGSGKYIFADKVEKDFNFDDISQNHISSVSRDPLYKYLMYYDELSDEYNNGCFEELENSINGDAIAKALNYGEAWVKTSTGYSYVYTYEFNGISSSNCKWLFDGYKDTYIDGRYIDKFGNYTGDNPPTKYYIFDGTAYPGTPFGE